ncbi:hypothetical protein DL764_008895 [Monosporascus ibericus]|uniref:F-box domain-containing protein n=1 Tax=Monosporascus ibericus TaxID=155417 RepID=A0A4Q4SYL7_9PEZI|nr:hypothetical protein DL764_008895 [Monosporascus ibericus]
MGQYLSLSTAAAPQQPFPFLRLPLEIRLQIYALLLVCPEPIFLTKPVIQDRGPAGPLHTAILRACRQVYGEASPVFWRDNVFEFSYLWLHATTITADDDMSTAMPPWGSSSASNKSKNSNSRGGGAGSSFLQRMRRFRTTINGILVPHAPPLMDKGATCVHFYDRDLDELAYSLEYFRELPPFESNEQQLEGPTAAGAAAAEAGAGAVEAGAEAGAEAEEGDHERDDEKENAPVQQRRRGRGRTLEIALRLRLGPEDDLRDVVTDFDHARLRLPGVWYERPYSFLYWWDEDEQVADNAAAQAEAQESGDGDDSGHRTPQRAMSDHYYDWVRERASVIMQDTVLRGDSVDVLARLVRRNYLDAGSVVLKLECVEDNGASVTTRVEDLTTVLHGKVAGLDRSCWAPPAARVAPRRPREIGEWIRARSGYA